ncbi:MAG: lytic murein transglycosylase, partial [Asticcacaulis sp.]
MTKRVLPLLLILTACSTATTVPSSSPVTPPPPVLKPKETVAAPTGSTPATEPRPVLTFEEWRAQFFKRAEAQGFERAFLETEFATVRPSERVVSLDGKQPEFSRPISAYVRGAV